VPGSRRRRVARPKVLRRACGVIQTAPHLPAETRAQTGHDIVLDGIRDFWWACLSAPDLTPVPALPTPPDSFPVAPAAIRHISALDHSQSSVLVTNRKGRGFVAVRHALWSTSGVPAPFAMPPKSGAAAGSPAPTASSGDDLRGPYARTSASSL